MKKYFLKPKSFDYWESFLITLFILITYFIMSSTSLSGLSFLLTTISVFLLMIVHASSDLPVGRVLIFSSIYLVVITALAASTGGNSYLAALFLVLVSFLAGMLTAFKTKGSAVLGMFSIILFVVIFKIGIDKPISIFTTVLAILVSSVWVYAFFSLLLFIRKKTRGNKKGKTIKEDFEIFKENLNFSSPSFIHALRLMIASVAGLLISILLNPHYAYWTVLTVALVLVFGYDRKATFKKGLLRGSGTVLGAIIASFLITYFHYNPSAHIENIIIVLLLFFTFLVKAINQMLFYAVMTMLLLFIMSRPFSNLTSSEELLEYRILFTFLGAAIAIAVRQIFWPKR